jgi:hypothetical protein
MAVKNDPEKEQAKLEAEGLTQFELQRIRSYRKLRYNYVPDSSLDYYDSIFKRDYLRYKPKRDANKRDARKSLRIGLLKSIKARFNPEEKKKIDNCLEAERMRLQEFIDVANQRERERCNRVNRSLDTQITNQKQALAKGSLIQAKEYFSAILLEDDYSLDGKYRYEVNCSVSYIKEIKRLVIDYRLPTLYEIPDTKEWKVDKNNELVEKLFTKREFLELYEEILLDLAIRVIGLAFDSDDQQIVSEIVFNGTCVYTDVSDDVIFIISILVTKKEFETSNIRRADFSSKAALSKFSKVVYLGDINADTPPKALTDRPPLSAIIPIQSNLYRQ